MENIAIYGAGGFGKETRFLLELINRGGLRYVFKGFVDDNAEPWVPLAQEGAFDSLAIAIAAPGVRRRIYEQNGNRYNYPKLVAPDVYIHPSVVVGEGVIICFGVRITVDVTVGDFTIINANATVGHDVKIGAFSSIMPAVNVSGQVTIGEGVFIGSGATILQGLKVGDGAVIGAGAVVTRDVPAGVVAKGLPARW